jgi:ABC-2 type transport system ATP-binding protein
MKMSEHKIKVKNVSKVLGGRNVLINISVEFYSGKIYGFIGRNGSGKSVFLKCLCGFMEVSEGQIFEDEKVLKKDIEYLNDCGFLIETPGFLMNESGWKNLQYLASVNSCIGKKEIYQAIQQVGLEPTEKKHVGKYSLGMRQRLGIAQAIMEDPGILILDEPMNGLDNNGVEMIRELLLELKKKGKMILIASHYKEDIHLLCDDVYEFEGGHMRKVTNI